MVVRALTFLGMTVLALVLLVLALFGLIQTPPGKAALARLASSLASTPGLSVEIEGITGFVPSDMGIARITLADSSGPFATVTDARLNWSPLALIGRQVDVALLEAGRVELMRRPVLPEPAATDAASSSGVPLLPVRIARLALPDIVLAEPVVGHAAQLGLMGSADLSAATRALALDFALVRHDAPGRIAGTARYAPETERLDLDLSAQEPAGGLIARAAGMNGLPELTAALKGTGTLDNWDGHLSLNAGEEAAVSGAASIRAVAAGRRFTFALDADVAKVLPADLAPLFEGRTELAGAATLDGAERLAIETATLRAAGLNGAVNGATGLDGRDADLSFTLTLAGSERFAALAPGASWHSASLTGTARGDLAAPTLDAKLTAAGLAGAGYSSSDLVADLRTRPQADGTLLLSATGTADGLSSDEPDVAAALGPNARFEITGDMPADESARTRLTGLTVHLTGLTARFAGVVDQQSAKGTLAIENLALVTLSPLVGRPIAGEARFTLGIDAGANYSQLALTVDGRTENLSTGIAQADGFFGKVATLSGGVAISGENSLSINDMKLTAEGLGFTVNGTLGMEAADLKAELDLANLSRIDPRLSGALEADGAFSGSLQNLSATARLSVPEGTAMGKPIQGLNLDVTASDITGNPNAGFRLSGTLAGRPTTGTGRFARGENDTYTLQGLDLAVGSARATGDVSLDEAGLARGRLAVSAPDLADLSALALTELAGALAADVTLDVADGRQRVAIAGTAERISAAGQTIASAKIDATVIDPMGVPLINGSADVRGANISGQLIENATVRANGTAQGSDLTIEATVQQSAVRAAGRLTPQGDGAQFRLDRLSVTRAGTTLATTAPATLTYATGTLTIDRLALNAGGGTATLSGRAGERLDLTADFRAVPLSLADLASPGLGLTGTLAGTARITGTPSAPTGNYQFTISRLSLPQARTAGAGPFDITARGELNGGRASVNAEVKGQFLQALTVTGSVPLGAGALDLAIRGTVDLALVNPMLANTAGQVSGRAAVDMRLTGTAAAPLAGGTVRVSGGRYVDSEIGVNVDRIEALITGTQRSLTISSFTGRTPNGGTLSGRGTIALDPAAGFPGRIDIDMANAQLVNSELMRLVADGKLNVEGAFLNAPRVGGRIVLRTLDVNIADRPPAGGVQNLDVRHVNAKGRKSPGVFRPQPRPVRPANAGIPLDLTISAPNNVFVRGMGIESELGGDIQLRGTTTAPVALGGFEMRRGSFDFVGRRLSFTRGRLTFTGTTDPELDFIAETTSGDVTARVIVTGPASSPTVDFTSTPTLPQDEVLSRLLFGRATGQLSQGQTLQVAQAIAQYSGGGTALNNLRRALGVDSLDIGTNEAGTGGQIGIGRRLNDNIYLGVRQGTTANSSKVTVDVDVTRNIRLQGATGANGAAEVGIGAQWDY